MAEPRERTMSSTISSLLVSEIRKLDRPLDCIIEHIPPDLAVMSKTKAWVERRLRQ
jgi:hypothetical protein